jgi:hypothetical protein
MHDLIQVLDDISLRTYTAARSLRVSTVNRLAQDERGEGVISMAIAVLIVAFLGALMWVAFNGIFNTASTKTSQQVNSIGGTGG